ncbi:MAG TPA: O-antigen ligase family protein [bacterium]|nr:O-antigen ligase family protein [bacterium]
MEVVKDKLLKYCDWLVGAFLILFVFWSPISITGAQTAVSFALLFWLVRMFLTKKFCLARNPLNIPIVAFLVAAAIGVIMAVNFKHSLKAYMTLGWMFIFFLIVNNVKDTIQFKRLVRILVLITTIGGAYGIFQHLTKIDFFGNVKHLRLPMARSTGFFDGPATFGNYILLVLPVVIGLSSYIRIRRKKRWLQLSGLIILTAIIFSYGRAVWIGLIVGLIFMGILGSRRLLLSILAGIMICSILILALPSLEFAQRVAGTVKSKHPVGDRTEFWEGSLRILRDYPITGVGWEGFRKVYPRYRPSEEEKSVSNAHNNFVDVAVDSGLLGLGIFLWLLVTIYKVGFHIFKELEDGYFKGFVWGFLGSLTAFLIAGLSQYNFGDSEVVMLFYFLLGMVMVIPRIKEAK